MGSATSASLLIPSALAVSEYEFGASDRLDIPITDTYLNPR